MNRKNIIIVSAIANATLLLILFISAVASREDKKSLPSAEVASSILEKNPDGMILLPQDNGDLLKKEIAPLANGSSNDLIPLQTTEEVATAPATADGLTHKLPEVASSDKSSDVVLVNPPADNAENSVSAPKVSEEKKNDYIDVVVKKGDSLDKLARRHHSTVQEIKKTNHLDGSFLQVGKKLRIPVREKAAKSDLNKKSDVSTSEGPEYYVVKHGDNPWTIAIKHHLKVDELLRLNHLSKEKAKKLRAGDKLRIR